MRRSRTLFVMLVVFCLALSSATASPNMWGWIHSDQSSETSEVPAETLTEANETSMKESTSSEVISDATVIVDEDGEELVLVKKSVLREAVGKFESAAGFTAKAKSAVAEAKADLEDNAVAYAEPRVKKVQYFATLDAEHGLGQDLRLGVSAGLIFKDCLIMQAGVMKKADFGTWAEKEEYTARVSLGVVF